MAGSEPSVIVCDVGGLESPDLGTIDALARLQLAARRLGRELRLRHSTAELEELIAFTGLDVVLVVEPLGETEEREE